MADLPEVSRGVEPPVEPAGPCVGREDVLHAEEDPRAVPGSPAKAKEEEMFWGFVPAALAGDSGALVAKALVVCCEFPVSWPECVQLARVNRGRRSTGGFG